MIAENIVEKLDQRNTEVMQKNEDFEISIQVLKNTRKVILKRLQKKYCKWYVNMKDETQNRIQLDQFY